MKRIVHLIAVIVPVLVISCAGQEMPPPTEKVERSRKPIPRATSDKSEAPIPTATDPAGATLSEKAKALKLGPGLGARFTSQSTTPEDLEIIHAIENGEIFEIDGLYFDRIGSIDGPVDAPGGAPAYLLVDEETKDASVAAWYDQSTNFVIEASTGYPLNVRSSPGIGILTGPNDEEFYAYGFAWYPRWKRILPEPVIQLLDDFYSEGIDHVRTNMENYQEVADPEYFGGDLNLVTWNEDLLILMEKWGPDLAGAPFMGLPDSGTVDIRDKRFQEAIQNQLVVVDQTSVKRYLESDYPANSYYNNNQSKDLVNQKLLAPLRNPNMYSDLQKLIILGAVYDDRGPLTLSIDFYLEGGYLVPGTGEKIVKIAPPEIDLMFGYDGMYLSKFPHELAHSIEYYNYDFFANVCLPNEDDILETFKYIMEYMWWVQQYPGNAPHWDWETINSGLVLARMLNGFYMNFSC